MPYIKQDFVDRIKEQADIVDIIGQYAKDMKKRGKNFFCRSFFTEERTPSFSIDPVKQRFKDYSSGRSGDVITFLMEKENLTYPEAIEWLAKHYGHNVEYEDAEWARKKEEKTKQKEELRKILRAAHRQYTKAFHDLPATHPAKKEIFEKRGYTEEDVAEWEIGYAPGKQFLYEMIREKGLVEDAKKIFLVGDKNYDKYWDRVLYPIHDINGLIIGFGGRDVSGKKDAAKWINPNDNALYKKEKTWFGLHKAKGHIARVNEAWIVEGYNDVIAWHRHGLEKTIASCGTAITELQIKMLKRFCNRVVLCFDGDKAGLKSLLKYIPEFLKEGFDVKVVRLPDCDPDEYSRLHSKDIKEKGLQEIMEGEGVQENGFSILIQEYIKGDALAKSKGAHELVKIAATVDDDAYREIYLEWIASESGVKMTKIRQWQKDERGKYEADKEKTYFYELPEQLNVRIRDIKEDVEKYNLFQANHRVWFMHGDKPPYHFRPITNFEIEFIQHMSDEKFPKRLVRMKNIFGEERVFDALTVDLNSPQRFDDTVNKMGNFRYEGDRKEFIKLRGYLMDREGVGRMIDILGWQPDGFWVFNNKVIRPGEPNLDIDDNGVFKIGKACYYVPSANTVYKKNDFKYDVQKKVRLVEDRKVSFSEYTGMIHKVHRGHGMMAILFTIASMFQDIVVKRLGNFPMLFLYGPASTGKDQLIEACQSFFGEPQTAINLESELSTGKANIREFAQLRNMISHLSEYKSGIQKMNGMLKGLWDRRGYKRGNIESHVGTESIPILSSVMLTGNEYPDSDALITRCVIEEMVKTDFNTDEIKRFDQLRDESKKGASHLTAQILQYRKMVEEKFKDEHRKAVNVFKSDLNLIDVTSRIISNVSVLGAFYNMFKDTELQFTFNWNDLMEHTKLSIDRQMRKLNTASEISKWWDCFLASIRTKVDPLRHGREFEVKDNQLYFQFTHCYNRVMNQWWAQYHEQTPSKSKIMDIIKKDIHFVDTKSSHYMRERKTSVWVVDLQKMPVYDDFIEAIEWQETEGSDYKRDNAPAQNGQGSENKGPENRAQQTNIDYDTESGDVDDLPF